MPSPFANSTQFVLTFLKKQAQPVYMTDILIAANGKYHDRQIYNSVHNNVKGGHILRVGGDKRNWGKHGVTATVKYKYSGK